MHTRLISILTAIEAALIADDPSPDDGSWQTGRTVNYDAGLARMTLAVKGASGDLTPRGAIHIQGFRLSDESTCLKASLSWLGAGRTIERSVYEKPGIDWTYEARRIAAEWAGGPPAEQTAQTDTTDDADDVRAVANG
ncbi:MAG TPA: hypothetical protein VMM36_09580 [Opitutaceae bacterium]|nr:hypothetical protein [Opitutaceae bacterium]